MATKKKGCGFLITALVLIIIGGALAAILGMGAFSTGKEFADSIQAGKSFVTPGSTTYTADGGDQASVWLSANDQSATGGVVVHVIDTSTNTKTTATKPSGSANMGNQHLVATFKIKPGKSYKVRASGVPDGSTLTVSNVSSNAVFSVVGKGFGAFAVFGVCGFLALIFGIIGLVRFFSSNDAPAPPHSPPPM